jgi:hypothetical protein
MFYETTADNGKITKETYLTQILPIVAEWVRSGKKFILEEDNNSGHGTSQKRHADGSWACPVR